jgi:hypothetical protein
MSIARGWLDGRTTKAIGLDQRDKEAWEEFLYASDISSAVPKLRNVSGSTPLQSDRKLPYIRFYVMFPQLSLQTLHYVFRSLLQLPSSRYCP